MSISILVVDDSDFARKVLLKSIEASSDKPDLVIRQAANGREALDELKAEKPDLMFLDLTMPVMDGYEVLESMAQMNMEVPTVVITADIQDEAQKKVKAKGVLGFLSKPIDKKEFAKLMGEIKIL